MTLVSWLKIFVLGYLTWQNLDTVVQSQKTANCTYYDQPRNWWSAERICKANNSSLLCYSSKIETQAILDSFIDFDLVPSIMIWLSSKDCLNKKSPIQCLLLKIDKKKAFWHFQEFCYQPLTFICCGEGKINQSTTSSTHSSYSTLTTANTTTSTSTKLTTWDQTTTETIAETIAETTVETTETTSTQNDTEEPQLFCASIYKNGIYWPKTLPGQVIIMHCPGNSIGDVVWTCNTTGIWVPDNPDTSQCQSVEVLNIKEKFNSTLAHETISALDEIVYDGENFHQIDLSDVVSMLSLLPERLFVEVSLLPGPKGWETMRDSVSKTTSVIDRVVSLDSIWTNINEERRQIMGSNILSTVDTFSIFLADTMITENEHNIVKNNIALKVQKVHFGSDISWMNVAHLSTDSITLDKGYDRKLDPKIGNLSVIFVHYLNMNAILLPSRETKDAEKIGTLNSAVVSATVAQQRKPIKIDSKVRITVHHSASEPNDTTCVFWDLQRNLWDTTGCKLESSNASHSTCVCDHLTNFAVLMDFQGRIDDVYSLPFFYITVIGCAISNVCLLLCVVVFTCYSCYSRNVWGLRYTIHRNLCLTLLVANIVLMAGLNKTGNQVVCSVVAGLLHYFYLSAFCWMLLEGFHIYLMLVVVFASKRSHWEKYYMFGYGLPLIIVAVTAISRPDGYGTDKVCWLSVENGVIWSFAGPVACILAVNLCVLIMAHWKASKISVKDDNISFVKRWLRVTVILFPILGLTWLFGFLYLGKRFEVMAYTFSALNSLQGLFIFICHCVLDTKARSMVLSSLRKKRVSVSTEVSGTQKKSRNRHKKISMVGPEPLQNQRDFCARTNVLKDTWNRWQKPWTFNFILSVSERVKV